MKKAGRPKKCSRKLNFNKLPTVQSNVNNEYIWNKISIIQSDIRNVTCNAIMNAANIKLLGAGGKDGRIRAKAGPRLIEKCRTVKGKLTLKQVVLI